MSRQMAMGAAALLLGVVLDGVVGPAQANWLPGDTLRSLNGKVYAVTTWDPDGAGPQPERVIAGGEFTQAGSRPAARVAAWDGANWWPVGEGLPDTVRALTVHNGNLYAGGRFGVARWDAQYAMWRIEFTLGSGEVWTLASFNDGSGPALYAGGTFKQAGGVAVNYIVKWDGLTCQPLGSGTNGNVEALAAFDDGAGPALYVAGWFTQAGSAPRNRVAKWDGTQWSSLGSGMDDWVYDLAVYGGELIAGGVFSTAGGVSCARVARWNGTTWQPLGTGLDSAAYALTIYNGDLIVSGGFTIAGGGLCTRIARWNGTTWHPLGAGISPWGASALTTCRGKLIAGGPQVELAGDVPVRYIAEWDGVKWSPAGHDRTDGVVSALAVHDDGQGPALYAGGAFRRIRGVPANRMARWDGVHWSPVGTGTDGQVTAMTTFEGRLIVGGAFSTAGGFPARSVASWDGIQWSALGDGFLSDYFDDLTVYNGELFAASSYDPPGPPPGGPRVLKWDGTQWTVIWSLTLQDSIVALEVFDDGAGPALYAGGKTPSGRVARWDGAAWLPVGNLSGYVTDLAVYDAGVGAALHAAQSDGSGYFGAVLKWDGQGWSRLGGTMNGTVNRLGAFDGGGAPALYAVGSFTIAGGSPARGIAKWDGSQWRGLGAGLDIQSYLYAPALAAYGDKLFVGGKFFVAGDQRSAYLARWSLVGAPYKGDLNCDAGVDFGDINPFVLALTNPSAYVAAFPDCTIFNGDANLDGIVNFGDINPFVALLANP